MDEKKNKKSSINMSVMVYNITANYVDAESLKIDPQGSWTGKPEEYGEQPVQDVDDL